eukprot:CAMPEP_0202371428 /NCGR_PEP_ID=MMETSP1127-20130417/2837_1 /ASSEMBLY_ACC=CAM_ASM_000462 /TAXON_ID=3047 /ORGANISM="Dunaliella tertiolecta, Strain CCMP1320" /LENGTH=93 /DNA_ID=CAMNT_0048967675 /DNA_START=615 /DNA_END=896 /DNA_ORIENTATION=+
MRYHLLWPLHETLTLSQDEFEPPLHLLQLKPAEILTHPGCMHPALAGGCGGGGAAAAAALLQEASCRFVACGRPEPLPLGALAPVSTQLPGQA